jgi:hypothetical protein
MEPRSCTGDSMIRFCCAEEQLMELCAGWCASAPLGARSSSVWLHVDELGLLQVPNVDLVARLEAILLELRRRLDDYAEGAVDEVVAADEGPQPRGAAPGDARRREQARSAGARAATAPVRTPTLDGREIGRPTAHLPQFPGSQSHALHTRLVCALEDSSPGHRAYCRV